MSELLAPAGNLDSFFAAVNNGADAVYLGLKSFSARQGADNFDREQLVRLIGEAKLRGVKVYVALNTIVKEAERASFFASAAEAWHAGADALILQDVFLGKAMKDADPRLVLHLSTQAGVNNVAGAEAAKEFGFDRVILSRETALEEIAEIAKILPTEVFVQGALCTAFSGQCYLSGFAGGNSGNRGRCKQPCRKRYRLSGGGEEREGYLISLADLSVGHKIDRLIEAGVTSFKIEGRMRRPEYVAAACRYYRALLDGRDGAADLSALKRAYNRGDYTEGYAFGQKTGLLSTRVQNHIGEEVGRIDRISGNLITVKGYQNPEIGDGFKILRKGAEIGGAEAVRAGGAVAIRLIGNAAAHRGDSVRITTDVRLNRTLAETKKTVPVTVEARLIGGEKGSLQASCRGVKAERTFDVGIARTAPLDPPTVVEILGKTGELPFAPSIFVETERAFLPRSVLNAERRALYESLAEALIGEPRPLYAVQPPEPVVAKRLGGKVAVIASRFPHADGIDVAVFAPDDYRDEGAREDYFAVVPAGKRYLYLPPFFNNRDLAVLQDAVRGFDGVYTETAAGYSFAAENGKQVFTGTGMHVLNRTDVAFAAARGAFAYSKEGTLKEVAEGGGDGYYTVGGSVKLMDLVHCPFGGQCSGCRRGRVFRLTDEEGRTFLLRRVSLSSCRFELYDARPLACDFEGNRLYNAVLHPFSIVGKSAAALRAMLPDATAGHAFKGVL